MILDEGRFRNWFSKADLPQDIRDTIENLLSFEDVGQQMDELANKNAELQKQIDQLKSTPAPAPAKKPGRYVAQGNTYPIKDILKSFGFRWDADLKVWYIKDGPGIPEIIQKVRARLKEQDENLTSTVEIVFTED